MINEKKTEDLNLKIVETLNLMREHRSPPNIGIVVSEWNSEVTSKLEDGARKTLLQYGITDEDIICWRVPGSFELPLAAKWMLHKYLIWGVICLGAVIRGETRHFDYVCQGVTQGIMQVNLETNRPVAFGVLTTDTLEQAIERAGGKYGNKGEDTAITVLRMLELRYKEWGKI